MSAMEKLVVALDLPTADRAVRLADKLRGRAGMFKVGSGLFTGEGRALARYLAAQGNKVFLDLKFHDIPNSVRAAAREAAALGVSMLTVHALGGRKMMEAAMEGSREACSGRPDGVRPLVLAVTLLTSLAREDLDEIGVSGSPEDNVVRLARLAQNAGIDGVVTSPREIGAIRRACGPRFVIATPGVRPAAAASNDQARTATAEEAIRAGADFLVVGRPILEAPDPVAAADSIVAEIEKALEPSLASAQKL